MKIHNYISASVCYTLTCCLDECCAGSVCNHRCGTLSSLPEWPCEAAAIKKNVCLFCQNLHAINIVTLEVICNHFNHQIHILFKQKYARFSQPKII